MVGKRRFSPQKLPVLHNSIHSSRFNMMIIMAAASHWARKSKKYRPKKLVKSNKSISRNFFLTKFHFLPFQNWPKINFWTGKKFQTAKNAISRKKFFFWFIWFHEVFCLDFFKFSASLWCCRYIILTDSASTTVDSSPNHNSASMFFIVQPLLFVISLMALFLFSLPFPFLLLEHDPILGIFLFRWIAKHLSPGFGQIFFFNRITNSFGDLDDIFWFQWTPSFDSILYRGKSKIFLIGVIFDLVVGTALAVFKFWFHEKKICYKKY